MTKINTKLLVFLSVLVCSLCLCFGLVACNSDNGDNTNNDDSGGEHGHTFEGFWLFDGAEGHYRLATCHPEVKSELEPHVDENGDFKCDVCGYVMHPHVDEDEDGVCDDCQTEIHKHTFEEEWTFNENKHWHTATCEHFIERSDYVNHSFVNGVCECGVKESEVKVYALYKNSPEYELFFPQWLEWLAENGVIQVEITDSGDGVYYYEDGTSELRFVGTRTVKVKAECDGAPLADVWFMVTMYTEGRYYELNGTIALGLAKTDASGIAVISFRPIGGYSSAKIEYRIRIAERKDIAVLQNVEEDEASLPFPNRYVVVGDDGFEFVGYEVSEDATGDGIAATIEFNFSKGWNAYNTIELPYHRYFKDQLNASGLQETGKTFEFVTSGDNLFDYMFLFAAQYSFLGFEEKDLPTIENNAKIAASGEYKILFTYEGSANVVLYSWNAEHISFNSGAYSTKEDGTPADKYVNSISGGTAGEGVYTGGNFIEFTIKPDFALMYYQFGILSDSPVKVTLTVERTGDYVVTTTPDFVFEVDENGNGKISNAVFGSLKTDRYKDNNLVLLGIEAMSAGTYVLKITPPSKTLTVTAGSFYARLADGKEYYLWEGGISGGAAQSLVYKNVITITDKDSLLYIIDYDMSGISWTITLEKYEPTTVSSGAWVYVPSTPVSFGETYQVPLNVAPGTYTLDIRTFGPNSGGESYPFTVNIGDKVYTVNGKKATGTTDIRFDYTATITVDEGDTAIALIASTQYAVVTRFKLTAVA